MSKPIENCIAHWHEALQNADVDKLDDLLADDAVFISPVVHSPQVGKLVAKAYLSAAFEVLVNPDFHYLDEMVGEQRAVLEFATELDGIQVNGVDMIRCNEQGQIVEFKVMVRPLKAINTVHRMMGEYLQKMTA